MLLSVHEHVGKSVNLYCSICKINNCILLYRESHCPHLEDCSPTHTATWQLRLSPPALQPLRWPETTVSAALGLGCDSALIRSPPLSLQAKTCPQPDRLEVQTHSLSCPNQGAESPVQCLTVTVTKLRPS